MFPRVLCPAVPSQGPIAVSASLLPAVGTSPAGRCVGLYQTLMGFCADLGTRICSAHPLRSKHEDSTLNAERSPLFAIPAETNYNGCFLNFYALGGPRWNVLPFRSTDKTIKHIYIRFLYQMKPRVCFKPFGWSGDTSTQVLRTVFRNDA